jgi:hypothetical protein
MTKNPLINAGVAAVYIAGIVLLISFATEYMQGPETLLIPITILSLLVLSVLVMGYVLLLQPLQLFLDGDKKGAIKLFGQTAGAFACIVVAFLAVVFFSAY